MKQIVSRGINALKAVIFAFLPSLITLGVFIGFALSNNFLMPQKQASITVTPGSNSLDIVSQISEKAIQASNNTVEMMKWIMVTFVIAGAALFWGAEKEVTLKISQIQRDYDLVSNILVKTDKQLNDLSAHYQNLERDLHDLPSRILPFEMAVAAYQAGKITEDDFLESQAWYSWQKWYFAEDATGYEELLIHKESREGLPSSIIRTAITVLAKLLEKKKKPGSYNSHDEEKSVKLILLLNLDNPL